MDALLIAWVILILIVFSAIIGGIIYAITKNIEDKKSERACSSCKFNQPEHLRPYYLPDKYHLRPERVPSNSYIEIKQVETPGVEQFCTHKNEDPLLHDHGVYWSPGWMLSGP